MTTREFGDFQSAKTRRENPYKTLLKLIISEPCPEKGLKIIKKHYKIRGFATRFQNLLKLKDSTGIRRFPKRKNALRKPLENLSQIDHFRAISGKGAPKSSKKHYKIRVSRRVFKTSQNAVTSPEFADFQSAKTRCGNPYKTCRKRRLLGAISEKGPNNHQNTCS